MYVHRTGGWCASFNHAPIMLDTLDASIGLKLQLRIEALAGAARIIDR
uniref:Uncharacterized protein n=1 Tax=Arundo donax TaxID=35708 RepID=A0A0A9A3X7_ARUDO